MNDRIRMIIRTLSNTDHLTINDKIYIYYWAQENHTNLKPNKFKSSISFKKQKGRR